MYLLASDFLLRQGLEDNDMDPQERRRIAFHLRQFVDAMSPSLLLLSIRWHCAGRWRRAAPARRRCAQPAA